MFSPPRPAVLAAPPPASVPPTTTTTTTTAADDGAALAAELDRYRRRIQLHGDPAFTELIDELREASPHFREWWPRHDVLADQAGIKVMPRAAGDLRFHHLQSAPTTHPELRLTIYAPADAATRAALDRL
jgi:hypothetical protein